MFIHWSTCKGCGSRAHSVHIRTFGHKVCISTQTYIIIYLLTQIWEGVIFAKDLHRVAGLENVNNRKPLSLSSLLFFDIFSIFFTFWSSRFLPRQWSRNRNRLINGTKLEILFFLAFPVVLYTPLPVPLTAAWNSGEKDESNFSVNI